MATVLIGGLVIGSIYVIVALGYNLALLGSGAFNFAQAAVVMFATFTGYQFGFADGLPLPVVVLASGAIGAAIGLVTELIAIRPVVDRGAHGELVTTVGVSIILEGVAVLIWGDQPLKLQPIASSDIVTIAGGRVAQDGLLIIALAAIAFVGLWVWSRYTISGLVCMASSEDRTAATLRGLDTRRVSMLSLAAAGALGGLAGPVVGTATFAVVTLGLVVTLKSFLALAIGGFGSFPGAAVGGITVGLTEALIARYLGAVWVSISLFVFLLAVLYLKPNGLFGAKIERQV